VQFLGALILASRDLSTSDSLKQPICTDEFIRDLFLIVEAMEILCGRIRVDPSLMEQITSFKVQLSDPVKLDRREAVLEARVRTIISGVQNNLKSRKFMFIPADQAEYWEHVEMFGQDFLISADKSALAEMMEAGNCFAAGRYTASAYHCMRVSEFGLRKLAKKFGVTIRNNGKPCPIDYGTWNKVISGIRTKIAANRQSPKGKRTERLLKFYSNAADHCEYMKDIWRNELSHSRRRYNKSEALAVISRVKDFVELFAKTDAKKVINKRVKARILELQRANQAAVFSPALGDKGTFGD
jgi:hypothetical protein